MLSIENLHSAYGEAHVLNGISMQVKPGEIVAILGRNGMGKTSLVRSIMNLSFPQKVSGTVSLSGTDITKLAPYKISANGLGYVPQGRRLFESLTVLEHLKILETTDSNGGERQMLAIARALMTGPKILLMDEPTEGLAPVMVELVEEILKKLKNDGLGILLVEQNFYSAMEVADRVYIIETGNVVWEGLPVDLLQNEELQQQFLGIH